MTLDEARHIAKTQACPLLALAGEALRVLVAELDKRPIASAESDAALSTLGPDRDGWVLAGYQSRTINGKEGPSGWVDCTLNCYRYFSDPYYAAKMETREVFAAIPRD